MSPYSYEKAGAVQHSDLLARDGRVVVLGDHPRLRNNSGNLAVRWFEVGDRVAGRPAQPRLGMSARSGGGKTRLGCSRGIALTTRRRCSRWEGNRLSAPRLTEAVGTYA
jgi:hypothetical protein